MHAWFSARLDAVCGNEESALRLYAAAVKGAWWFAGQNQHPILNEALLYAVGLGEQVAADYYWDKACLLGLNKWPKQPLDKQELRRLAFAFEKMFAPLKAEVRIPPRVEVLLRSEPYTPDSEQIKNPNRKVKFAEGRSRRTPLMEAIRDASLDDVRKMIAAGGDANDYITESGEGPLTYSMRRACDRKDPEIMEYLLQMDLLPETVNRSASTKRETPLKIAIEMASPSALERLIFLGANVEAECDTHPSALCYAMALFYESVNRDDGSLDVAYMMGQGRGAVHDAKDGAVLDIDLAKRRQLLRAFRDGTDRNKMIFKAVRDYMFRQPGEYKDVIERLLQRGANPNRRYKVQYRDIAEWTPTLFAAQVGDLELFKALVSSGGDPSVSLMPPTLLERFDALWVATYHENHAIMRLLTEKAGSF